MGVNGFAGINLVAFFWTSTENVGSSKWLRALNWDDLGVFRFWDNKNIGLSVRCIKD
jgi:hypothetical protein